MEKRCGKPTASGKPCNNSEWCGVHPDPPMVRFHRLLEEVQKGWNPIHVGSMGADHIFHTIVQQVIGPAQGFLQREYRRRVQEGIQAGTPKDQLQEELREMRRVLDALTSWHHSGE